MTDTQNDAQLVEKAEGVVADLRRSFDRGHTRPIEWRKAQLDALVRMLEEGEERLLAALASDLGRPRLEGWTADIGTTAAEVRYARKRVGSWAKPRRAPLPLVARPGRGRIIPEPLGVVLVIAPWNYPVQLLLEPLAAAIAAGNAVVVKPSEHSPATSAALAELIPSYLDGEAVAVMEGGVDVATALLEQRFDHIFYTGSTPVGKVVMRAAAEHLTPVTLELGGKSPTIVHRSADIEVATRRIAWGKWMNAGQTCVAPDYVLVDRAVRDEVVDGLAAAVERFYGDDPKASADLGRIVDDRHFGRLVGLLGEQDAGTVAFGGESDADERYLAPTVVVDPSPDARIMQEEIFGPVLPLVSVDSVDEAIEFVADRPKPLALYVFAGDRAVADRVLAETSSGGACVNHTVVHVAPPELPFGGVGPSGAGRYHGRSGFDTFSNLKSVLRKPQKPDPSFLYPPYTDFKERLVRRFLR